MDAWFRSLFGGLVLAGLAVGGIIAFNLYGQDFRPFLEQSTGMSDSALLVVLLLTFLVGFSLAYRPRGEEIEVESVRRKHIVQSPNARIKPTTDYTEVEEIEFVQEAYISYLQDRTRKLEPSRHIILKVKLYRPMAGELPFIHRGGPLQRDILLYYLEKLKQFENFKYVVFVDWFGRFLFFALAKELREEIEPIEGTHIIDLMNGYVTDALQSLPLFNKHCVSTHATNARVLHLMAKESVNQIMVVTHTWGKRHFGVVELNKLLARILLPAKAERESRSLLRAFRSDYDWDEPGGRDPAPEEDEPASSNVFKLHK